MLCKGGRGGLGNRNFATARASDAALRAAGRAGRRRRFFVRAAHHGRGGHRRLSERGQVHVAHGHFPRAARKWRRIPSPRCTRRSASWSMPTWKRLTVCDVPGLIEGAHQNVGLGHAFLRHIQRCKILVLLLDMAGTDNRAPWDDYAAVAQGTGTLRPGVARKAALRRRQQNGRSRWPRRI